MNILFTKSKSSQKMSTSKVFFSFSLYLFFISLSNAATNDQETCSNSVCRKHGPDIKFPFRLSGHQVERCGYPGFNLSCGDRGVTVLNLPSSQEFLVREIDYVNQEILVYDQDNCIARRLLNLNLSGSPFGSEYYLPYTFISCSMPIDFDISRLIPLRCLSTSNDAVFAATYTGLGRSLVHRCQLMKTIRVPIPVYDYRFLFSLVGDLRLAWGAPNCGYCVARGGKCGFRNSTGSEIGCFHIPQRGLSRPVRYVISIGIGIPSLVCAIGVACYVCNRVKPDGRSGRDGSHAEFSSAINPQPAIMMVGLDEPTIGSYPKIVLGRSRRLPDPDDKACSICLSEYQPTEELRTIPDCKHSFHANCIDEWLRMNATCPLCRNSPMPVPPQPVHAA